MGQPKERSLLVSVWFYLTSWRLYFARIFNEFTWFIINLCAFVKSHVIQRVDHFQLVAAEKQISLWTGKQVLRTTDNRVLTSAVADPKGEGRYGCTTSAKES